MDPNQSLKDLDSYLQEENPESPFRYACKQKMHQLSEPKATGFLYDNLPKKDAQGIKAKDFFKEILGRLRVYSEENKNMANNIYFCTGNGKLFARCKETLDWTKSGLGEMAKDARYNLSLAQEPSDLATGVGRGSFTPNKRLTSSTTYKYTRWDPLTKEELEVARKDIKSYGELFKADMKSGQLRCGNKTEHRCFHDELIDIRARHLEEYQAIMAQAPFLQFIKSSEPSTEEIHQAAKLAKEQVQKEAELLDKYEQMIAHLDKDYKPPLEPAIPSELSQLFMYQNVVDGFLLSHPKYCGIAMALKKKMDSNQFKADMTVLAPTLALSVIGSPALGVMVGLGATGYFGNQAYNQFQLVKTQNLSEIVGEKGVATPVEIMEYRKNLELEVGLLPLNFVGARASTQLFKRSSSRAVKPIGTDQ